MKKTARNIYALIVLVLIITTVMALLDGGYHIIGGLMAAIAAGSFITSLMLYFASASLFNKYEDQDKRNLIYNVLGVVLYLLCFPINLWIIYSNLDVIITGGPGWAFG